MHWLARLLRSTLRSGRTLLVLLGALLLTIQAMAIWGIVDARQRTARLTRSEMEAAIHAQAATVAAALATLHGDLRYFVSSRPVAQASRELASRDPVSRRWSRLELEGAALLFLGGHPALARVIVEGESGELLAAVGWRQGAAVNLRRDEIISDPPAEAGLHRSVWRLTAAGDGASRALVWLAPAQLVRQALPAVSDLEVRIGAAPAARQLDEEELRAPVAAPGWRPPLRLHLSRPTGSTALSGSMEQILVGFRRTLLVNLIIIAASSTLGIVVLRQTRRATEAAAELRHGEERLELQRQVRHSDRLAAVGRLAAGVAHEINNPLAGIVNYLSLLKQELDEGDVAAARGLVERIRDGADSATEVVRQVLTFADPGRVEQQPVDVTSLAERTFRFVQSNPAHRHLEFALAAPDQPLLVMGDSAALSQLVLNLLLNACDVQPQSGHVELHLSHRDGEARLEICDRGPGLAQEVRQHLFEPFYSTRGSTGLGLAVCHGIVASHGGSIGAVNRPRGGARFVVTLPLHGDGRHGREAEA